VVEPLVLRLTLQRQAEQGGKKGAVFKGNAISGRPERGVLWETRQRPVGRLILEREIQRGDRLTARPKHSDFQERISLRGEIKE